MACYLMDLYKNLVDLYKHPYPNGFIQEPSGLVQALVS